MKHFQIKSSFILYLLLFSVSACQTSEPDSLAIIEQYYQALNDSDYEAMRTLLPDSITAKELDYVMTYSQEDYIELMKWDSVFHPSYKILSSKGREDQFKTQVSKQCKRILFLNEEPIITNETVLLENGKVREVSITSYEVFNDSLWNQNRAKLVDWIDQHHPDLTGFLQDQTKQGAINYLQAIDHFKNQHPKDK